MRFGLSIQVAYDNAVSDDNSQPGLTYDSDESSTELPAIRKPTKKVQEVEKNEPEETCTEEPEISVVEEEEEEKVVEVSFLILIISSYFLLNVNNKTW